MLHMVLPGAYNSSTLDIPLGCIIQILYKSGYIPVLPMSSPNIEAMMSSPERVPSMVLYVTAVFPKASPMTGGDTCRFINSGLLPVHSDSMSWWMFVAA